MTRYAILMEKFCANETQTSKMLVVYEKTETSDAVKV